MRPTALRPALGSALANAPAPGASAGAVLLGAAVAGTAGALMGGPLGLVSGVLLYGGARNGYVASRDWSAEDQQVRLDAGKAGLLGLAELALGGYCLYQLSSNSSRR